MQAQGTESERAHKTLFPFQLFGPCACTLLEPQACISAQTSINFKTQGNPVRMEVPGTYAPKKYLKAVFPYLGNLLPTKEN